MANVSYFYLRGYHDEKFNGTHRFACIGLEKTESEDILKMSIYLHNPKNGNFVAKFARKQVEYYLKSITKNVRINTSKLQASNHLTVILRLFDSCEMYGALVRYLLKYSHINQLDTTKNESVIKGALSELDITSSKTVI